MAELTKQYTIEETEKPRYQRHNDKMAFRSYAGHTSVETPGELAELKERTKEYGMILAKEDKIQMRYAQMLENRQQLKQGIEKNPEPVNRVERNDGPGFEPLAKDLAAEGRQIGRGGIVEKTFSLETKSNNQSSAYVMVEMAKEKGWDRIKVTGSETFRKQAWEKGAEVGLKVEGYSPSIEDQKKVANKVLAKVFAKDPNKAIEARPELKDAKIILDAIDKQAKLHGLDKKQLKIVHDRVVHNIAKSLEQGRVPKLPEQQKTLELER